MRPPWIRALTGCLQMVVRSSDDIEVEAGEVEVGEIRARAFSELAAAFDEERMLSLSWLALADLAVWPQLPVADAEALARLLETGGAPRQLAEAWAGTGGASVTTSATCMLALLPIVEMADRRVRNHSVDATIDLSPLRQIVNVLARESGEPIEYWEKWLRRVVPAAAVTPPQRAKALAIAALRCTFPVPKAWKYIASFETGPGAPKRVRVHAVALTDSSSKIACLGVFSDQEPANRQIEARFTPAIPVDAWRMGFLFQSICMTDLLDDAMTGYYDTVSCENTVTGETWTYSPP